MITRRSDGMVAGLWGLVLLLVVCLGHPTPEAGETLAARTACCSTSTATAVPATPALVIHGLQVGRRLAFPNAIAILPSLALSIYHPPEL
jgi:hypothetical protein